MIGGWRKQNNEELHYLYSSPCIIRMINSRRTRWTGHIARMGRRGMHIGFWWERKKERKRPLERPRRMWKDNIEMDLRGIDWGVRKYVLTYKHEAHTIVKYINLLTFLYNISYSDLIFLTLYIIIIFILKNVSETDSVFVLS
jgi:hypothetical protein